MDQKSWLWRRKSLEKTVTGNDEVRMSSKDTEIKNYSTKRSTNLKKSVEILNEKLTSTIAESNAKDELVKQHAKVAEEAIAGWEKAEAEALGFKRELETAIRLKETAEDRLHHLDSTLKECMLQLRHSREEHDRKILEATMKAAREYDKMRADFEDKLNEKNKVICEIDFTNSQLISTVQMKEKLIDNLNSHNCRIEAELNELLGRLDHTEKENSSLKYEVFMIQKELEIRHEDRNFSQKAADASHKQHLNDVKKITKLETECQRLRLLVQKRLPGPAALARMKLEVEALGREKTEFRRKMPPSVTAQPENVIDKRRIAFLTEQLSVLEEEKILLMHNLQKIDTELQASRYTRAQTSPTVEHFKVENDVPGKMRFLSSGSVSSDLTLMPITRDGKNSAADSWASPLKSEDKNSISERSQSPTCTSIGASDLSLMDDFAEMEKLALVSVEVAKDKYRKDYSPVLTGKEVVPFEDCRKDNTQKSASCIEDVLMLVLQHSRVTHKSYETSLEEVRNALAKIGSTGGHDEVAASSTSPPLLKTNCEKINSNICKSVQKITHLIEGIGKHEISPGCKSSSTYSVRMFQWKSSELCDILHRFVQKCNDLLKEKVSYDLFFIELASTLEWVMNHCFSLQDVPSMKASIKKKYEWEDTHSESEVEECKDIFPLSEKISQFKLLEENILLKGEISKIDSRKKLLEDKLQSTENLMETLRLHVQESDKNIANLQKELALAYKSEDEIENQQKSQKILHGCLDTEEIIAKNKFDDPHNKFQCSEVKLEDKNLQQQGKSVAKNDSLNVEAEPTRMKWDISMASEKLAECQETILNLGKQLKALSSPSDAIVVLDKAAKATSPVRGNKHASLLEQILGEDGAKDELCSPKTKEIICTTDSSKDGKNPNNPNTSLLYGSRLLRRGDRMEKSISKKRDSWEKCNSGNGLTPLAIIPVRPKSRNFLVRLFIRRRRGPSKRAFPAIPTR